MRKKFSDKWFYGNVPFWVKYLQIFIKGDLIIILPFLFILFLIYFLDSHFAIIIFLVFFTLRQIGEMIYWIVRQFFNTGYRPYDFGLTNLNNKAVYIIYQLLSLTTATICLSLLLYVLK